MAGGQMASGEALPRGGASQHAGTSPGPGTGQSPGTGRGQTVTGVVVLAHGGQASSIEPTAAAQPAVLRMVPIAAAIRHALRGSGTVVLRPRFGLRGWNGDQASPVHDLKQALDGIVGTYGPVPIVVIGHSMGARAAMRAAGHPAVYAAAGLAPWLPPGEPVEQLSGRRVLVAHGTADGITNPQETWAYVQRARTVTQVAAIEVRDGDHPMLRRARLWHAIAAEFARAALELPAGSKAAGPGSVAAAVTMTAWEPPRTIM
jgi:alpha-beta hydrolase superfamily lysophospholipase